MDSNNLSVPSPHGFEYGGDTCISPRNTISATRNMAAPVLALPPEILSHILMLVREAYIRDNEYTYKWIRVSHVCRYFRETALACTTLWSDIRSPQYQNSRTWTRTQAMFARSKDTPVTFRAYLHGRGELWDLMLHEMRRIETLDLTISANALLEDVQAPELRTLAIALTGDMWSEQHLEEMLNLRGLPKLENLRVASHAGPSWADKDAFPKTLRILNIVQHNRTPRPLDHILNVLQNLPYLESLDLEGVLPPFVPGGIELPTAQRRLTLPQLHHITLTGSASRIAVLLSNLILPNVTEFKLNCVVTTDVALSLLAPVVCTRLDDSPFARTSHRFTAFSLDETAGPTETSIFASSSEKYDKELLFTSYPPPRIFAITFTHDRFLRRVPEFIAQLPLGQVRTLSISIGEDSRSNYTSQRLDLWHPAFRPMIALDRLDVICRPRLTPPHHYQRRRPQRPGMSSDEDDMDVFPTIERESIGMRRMLHMPRTSHRAPLAELEMMWNKLREMFPSVEICTVNGANQAEGTAALERRIAKLRYPLIRTF